MSSGKQACEVEFGDSFILFFEAGLGDGSQKVSGEKRRNNNEDYLIGRKLIACVPEVDRLPRVEHPLWNVFNQHIEDNNIHPATCC